MKNRRSILSQVLVGAAGIMGVNEQAGQSRFGRRIVRALPIGRDVE
jgi:hypothetical protein